MQDGASHRALQTRELEVLLRDIVERRHGATALRVMDSVVRLQGASLHSLCADLDGIPENTVRQQLASLMKHEAVSYDEGTDAYTAAFGTGVLPAFFSAIGTFAADTYHHAGELVAETLFEFHDLAPEAIVKHVVRAHPDVDAAVRRALQAMQDDEVLVPVSGSGGVARAGGTKRHADDDSRSLQFNWPIVLSRMRSARVRKFVSFRMGATAERVLTALLANDASRPSPGRTSRGFLKLQASSSPQSLGAIQRRVTDVPPSTLLSTVDALVSDTDAILIPGTGSSTGNEQSYAVSFVSATRLMQRELFEGIVLSRHGIVGCRIARLLAENQAMEDRFVAEEALVTHADARTTLTAMLRDGFVKLVELPKASHVAERVAKNSIFLWMLHEDQLLETVQMHVVRCLCHARTSLTQELEAFRQSMPPSYFTDPANTILSQAEMKLASRHEVQRAALQRAVAALQERVLVALYF